MSTVDSSVDRVEAARLWDEAGRLEVESIAYDAWMPRRGNLRVIPG